MKSRDGIIECEHKFDTSVHLGQGFREGNTDTSFFHLLLEVFDAILPIIIISSYGAHPSPAKVKHQLGDSCGLVLIIWDGPQESGELKFTHQSRAS